MSLEVLWFGLLVATLATWIVLDGFDFGVGIAHLFVARTDGERRATLRSIGPVWDGNEVWLIAGGTTYLLAFPAAFAASFSGFYLPLMIVLWLLVFRALAIELRSHLDNAVWRPFWDAAFAVSSAVLALVLGAAIGNVVRGVSFGNRGDDEAFFAPLFTDLGVNGPTGVIDWYTLLAGICATAALAHHGALWLAYKVDGPVEARAGRLAARLWPAVLALTAALTAGTLVVQPRVLHNLGAHPWGALFPALAFGGLLASVALRRRGRPRAALRASAAFIAGLVASAAFGVFPYLLPGRRMGHGLTLYDTAAGEHGLTVALAWWIPGMLLACGYAVFIYRRLPARFSVDDEAEH